MGDLILFGKMLKGSALVPIIGRVAEPFKVTSVTPTSSLVNYLSVRNGGKKWLNGSRFHMRETPGKTLGNQSPRLNLVDPQLVTIGKPVSATLAMGEDMVQARKFEFNCESLNARGFLRFQKEYSPQDNAAEIVTKLCRDCFNTKEDERSLLRRTFADNRQKYEVLTKAQEEFKHCVPNSMLHMMNTVYDIVDFYCTPVKTTTPYEELIRNSQLPANIHVQKEPVRFDIDNPFYHGMTAFTKSSTIVTGLRSKKKYKGYEAKMTWP